MSTLGPFPFDASPFDDDDGEMRVLVKVFPRFEIEPALVVELAPGFVRGEWVDDE